MRIFRPIRIQLPIQALLLATGPLATILATIPLLPITITTIFYQATRTLLILIANIMAIYLPRMIQLVTVVLVVVVTVLLLKA